MRPENSPVDCFQHRTGGAPEVDGGAGGGADAAEGKVAGGPDHHAGVAGGENRPPDVAGADPAHSYRFGPKLLNT